MPHQCTGCGHSFEDGSKEMLSGCPSCGGKKFQFIPAGTGRTATKPSETTESTPPSGTGDPAAATDDAGTELHEAGRVERAASTVRGWVSDGSTDGSGDDAGAASVVDSNPDPDSNSDPDPDTEIVASEDPTAPSREDSAQAAARSTVVSREELPASPPTPGDLDESEEPDLETLRRELNEQFESIKILEPGQYELNLMELFDREERIIAIEEDGRYVIDVPEGWRDGDEE